MGNNFAGQHASNTNKRQATGNSESSDFAHPHPQQTKHRASPAPDLQQPAPQPPPPPLVPAVKTPKEKLDDIAKELEHLANETGTVKSGCGEGDKLYRRLDEYITRCLLKLDEIERSEEINTFRKSLINLSNKLLDRVQSIASGTSEPTVASESAAGIVSEAAAASAVNEPDVSMETAESSSENDNKTPTTDSIQHTNPESKEEASAMESTTSANTEPVAAKNADELVN